MSAPEPKTIARSRRRPIVLGILVLLALVVLAAWFARARIVSYALVRTARSAGIEVDWRELSIEGLSRARLVGMRAQRQGDLHVTADLVEIEFSAFDLARGNPAGLKRVRIDRLSGFAGPFARTTSKSQPRDSFTLTTALPEVAVTATEFEFRQTEGRRAKVVDLVAKFDGENATLDARTLTWIDAGEETSYPLTVRGSYRAGRFVIERAAWDPRIVFEKAQIDVADARLETLRFEGAVAAFGGTAQIHGRLEEDVIHATAVVRELDVGSALSAYLPSFAADAAGVVDLVLDASVPVLDVKSSAWKVRVRARDVHYRRYVDEVSFEAQTTPRGIAIVDGLIAHGENAACFSGMLPPVTTDFCLWLDAIQLRVELVSGDVRSLLEEDVGLSLRSEQRWQSLPVAATGVLADGRVSARVQASGVDVGSIVSAFAGQSPIEAQVDLEADVQLDLHRLRDVKAEGVVHATDVRVADRTFADLVGRVTFSHDSVEIEDFFGHDGRNQIEAGFVHVPRAALNACLIDHLERFVVTDLRAEIGDVPALLGVELASSPFERLNAHRVVAAGALFAGELHVTRGELATDAGSAQIVRGTIPLSRDVAAILHDPALDLELDLRFEDIAAVVHAVAPLAYSIEELPHGSVVGTARVRGQSRGPSAALELSARGVSVRDLVFDNVEVRAELDDRSVRVAAAEARGTIGALTLSGSYEFASGLITDARLHADLVDVSRVAPGRLPSGAVKADITANGTLDSLVGSVELEAHSVVWKDVHIDELDLAARSDKGSWTIERARLAGHGLEAELAGSISSLAPDARQRTIVVETLSLVSEAAQVAATAPTTITQDGEVWSLDHLELAGNGGAAELSFGYADGASHLELSLTCPLPRETLALAGIVAESANVDAHVTAVLRDRELTCETRGKIVTEAAAHEMETALEWNMSLRDRRARIEHLTLVRGRSANAVQFECVSEFPLDPLGDELLPEGPLALHFSLDVPDIALLPFVTPSHQASGAIAMSSDLSGTWALVNGTLEARVSDAAVSGVRSLAELGRLTGTLRLASAEQIRLDAADFVVDDLVQIRAAGILATPLDLRALLHAKFGTILRAPIDFALRVDADDLGPLAARLPTLRRTQGRVHADMRAGGTLTEPTFSGEGTLSDGEIRTTTNLPSIVGVNSSIHFDGKKLFIDELAGEMGGAPFSMTGTVSLLGEVPELDLKLDGSSLLLWRERDVTVRADADLTLEGPLSSLVLSGDLALRDGRYTKKFDFLGMGKRGPKSADSRGLRLFELDEPPFSTMRFDVQVTSATPFAIQSNIVRGSVTPSLTLLGTGALPELRGNVLVEPSRVLLPSGALRVRSGRIEFRPDRPDVPDLDIQASARLQGYDIEVNVSGSYDDPRIELSSVPPLPREDLALLLITGRPPGNALSGAGQRAAFDIAVYIARDVAVAWFESDEEQVESLAERLEVVLGADTTKSGADAVLVRLRLFGDLSKGRSAIFATGERDVYDFYNFGLRFVFTFE